MRFQLGISIFWSWVLDHIQSCLVRLFPRSGINITVEKNELLILSLKNSQIHTYQCACLLQNIEPEHEHWEPQKLFKKPKHFLCGGRWRLSGTGSDCSRSISEKLRRKPRSPIKITHSMKFSVQSPAFKECVKKSQNLTARSDLCTA